MQIKNVDISDFNKIKKYFKGISWVFHLAALADIVPSIKNPMEYHRSNVDGTINVLENARINNIKKFIYTASSSCYGIPDKYPTPETAPINLEYPYAVTKYLGEKYSLSWNRIYNLPVISLRLFNVYGPLQSEESRGLIPTVINRISKGEEITIYGDGNNGRDFVYVNDVVKIITDVINMDKGIGIFNLGSGKLTKINDVVNTIGKVAGKKPLIRYEPVSTPDTRSYCADTTKLLKYIGYMSSTKFHEGIIHSKDAFYCEMPEMVPRPDMKSRWQMWKKAGALVTEMEASTMFVLAQIRGWRVGGIMAAIGDTDAGELIVDPKKGQEEAIKVGIAAIKILLDYS